MAIPKDRKYVLWKHWCYDPLTTARKRYANGTALRQHCVSAHRGLYAPETCHACREMVKRMGTIPGVDVHAIVAEIMNVEVL
jgi:hypothetical protein